VDYLNLIKGANVLDGRGNAKFELSPVMITNIRCSHIINNMSILNASPGFGTQLTEVEKKSFLGDSKLNIHIGTIDSKGDPNIHPTWYYFDATNNKFYIETSKSSKKIVNLNRKYHVYYCVDDPNPP
jgi:hypothetical protein